MIFIAGFFHSIKQQHGSSLRELSILCKHNFDQHFHFVITPENSFHTLEHIDKTKYYQQENGEHGIPWEKGTVKEKYAVIWLRMVLGNPKQNEIICADQDTLNYVYKKTKCTGKLFSSLKFEESVNEPPKDTICDVHDLNKVTQGKICCTLQNVKWMRDRYDKVVINIVKENWD